MPITFDTSGEPLYLQLLEGRSSYDEVDAHFSELEAFCMARIQLDPGWRPIVFADARRARGFGARERRRLRQCFARLGPVLRERVVAHAILVQGRMGSGALNAVF